VIEAKSSINTYKAMMLCDSVLLYSTTAGLELACMGIPVITAGEAWFRGKGIGQDITSFEQYDKILSSLPYKKRISDDEKKRALKYAYHFYLRKMLPISSIEPQPFENASYKIPKLRLSDLKPGNDRGLDLICEGILNDGSFVFDYENQLETSLN
jgi:capsule polysaccharide export protein KpsC/LpsZ